MKKVYTRGLIYKRATWEHPRFPHWTITATFFPMNFRREKLYFSCHDIWSSSMNYLRTDDDSWLSQYLKLDDIHRRCTSISLSFDDNSFLLISPLIGFYKRARVTSNSIIQSNKLIKNDRGICIYTFSLLFFAWRARYIYRDTLITRRARFYIYRAVVKIRTSPCKNTRPAAGVIKNTLIGAREHRRAY